MSEHGICPHKDIDCPCQVNILEKNWRRLPSPTLEAFLLELENVGCYQADDVNEELANRSAGAADSRVAQGMGWS